MHGRREGGDALRARVLKVAARVAEVGGRRAASHVSGRMAEAVRGHGSVENILHWQLDVSFREDEPRIREDHGPENFSRLCRVAQNVLKRDKSVKIGVHGKRLKAGWDEP